MTRVPRADSAPKSVEPDGLRLSGRRKSTTGKGSGSGTLLRAPGGYFAQFSVGGGKRKGALLTTCDSEATARRRMAAIGELVAALRQAGHTGVIPNTIVEGATADAADFDRLRTLVRRIVDGKEPELAGAQRVRRQAASVAPPRKPGVYFVQSAEPGNPIKIGVARNIAIRFAGLQTAHAWPLVLRAWIPGGPAEEEALHLRFAGARLRGEWFRATAPLESFISECEEGWSAAQS